MVPINMPVRNLETYICKQENLNPRYHSLQSVDFKHQCFDAGCAVGEIEFSELRLMDKRGNNGSNISYIFYVVSAIIFYPYCSVYCR
jgi:hypothetical protein